jgi:2-polyprenyl-3-methyl-5-hydroxy-6-metoxy-1,4-benzoquinol methylase
VVCGIPDFRILPDRYIPIEDDREKGRRLDESGRDFAGMLDLYWAMTPEVAPELAQKFRRHQLAEERIGRVVLEEVGSWEGSLVDVGCATGGLVAAAARRGGEVVGVDVAFRWLVVGKVRLREAGVSAMLVCANAEYLPFPDETFGALTANDLVEHVVDPAPVMRECRRVLWPGGRAYFSTNNRYSVLPEPHVGVWGVGWLPRALQARYVEMLTARPYRNICLRSGQELQRFAGEAGFDQRRIDAAPLSSAPDYRAGAQTLYRRLRGWRALRWVGPRLQLLCRK